MMDGGGSARSDNGNSGLDPRDQELIAAFIDRRMSDEDRRAFMRRLDEEETLYEVFVETVRYRDQESGRPAEVIEHPAARRRWGRLTAAAALVAAALTPVVLLNLPAARYASRLVDDGLLASVLDERWYDKGWSTMRGAAPGTGEFDTAFRLGVRQVDREVALRLGRGEDARYLGAEIDALLGGLDLGEVMQAMHARVLDPAAAPQEALERAEAFDESLRQFLGEAGAAYDLGQWAEAGILAARAGNTDLLGGRAFRRALGDFPRREWAESGPRLAGQLSEVEGLLEGPADQIDLVRLEGALTAIVEDR